MHNSGGSRREIAKACVIVIARSPCDEAIQLSLRLDGLLRRFRLPPSLSELRRTRSLDELRRTVAPRNDGGESAPHPHPSSPGLTGRPSIPETPENNREAAAYWIVRSSRTTTVVVESDKAVVPAKAGTHNHRC